ncbi:hypothetical protein [Devosia sp. Leaf64]|uniref:hypothetical protein n=1 Tax=Devosia sp. Leaf64 TaxID=1736229 RepID=UPI000715EE03|nr:hypothetical protein [Devosia sp. Leaf64]KQN74987.1 hypothetical protein ASE94_01300 [Devosia sp. Leaf64]
MMRNLFKVLLVSSALVAVSAPSAYATPQEEAAAATSSNFDVLATLIQEPTLANLNLAVGQCAPGDKLCVINLLTAYGQLGIVPNGTQLATIAQTANVEFTQAELSQYSIGAVGGAGGGAGAGAVGGAAVTGTPESLSPTGGASTDASVSPS